MKYIGTGIVTILLVVIIDSILWFYFSTGVFWSEYIDWVTEVGGPY